MQSRARIIVGTKFYSSKLTTDVTGESVLFFILEGWKSRVLARELVRINLLVGDLDGNFSVLV
jgi:hypothetical protein